MKMSVQTKPAVQAKKPIRILLVEDQEVLRLGIKLSFHDSPDLQIVGEAADGPTAVTMAEELQPDLILMDIGLPEFDGIVATRRIKAETGSKILILSSHGEDECRDGQRPQGEQQPLFQPQTPVIGAWRSLQPALEQTFQFPQ